MHIEQMTPLQRWLYAGACVLLPVLWGLLIVGASNLLERGLARGRRCPAPREEGRQPLEYHI